MLSTIACCLFMWMISNLQALLRIWKKHGLASKEQSTLVTLNLNEKLILLHIFLALRRLLQHGPNIGQLIFGNMTPSTKLGQGIISSHVRSSSSLVMRGEFAKSLHSERVTMFDKNVEFKGFPVLNMHMSDESSAIVEDDMTVDQKIQTIDFWTGRTIFKYGDESGNSSQFALPSKNRPGPHRDKRNAKNEKKAQRFKALSMLSMTSLVV